MLWDGMRWDGYIDETVLDGMGWMAMAIAQVFSSLDFSSWSNLGYK